jgi:hypothetical protein
MSVNIGEEKEAFVAEPLEVPKETEAPAGDEELVPVTVTRENEEVPA